MSHFNSICLGYFHFLRFLYLGGVSKKPVKQIYIININNTDNKTRKLNIYPCFSKTNINTL